MGHVHVCFSFTLEMYRCISDQLHASIFVAHQYSYGTWNNNPICITQVLLFNLKNEKMIASSLQLAFLTISSESFSGNFNEKYLLHWNQSSKRIQHKLSFSSLNETYGKYNLMTPQSHFGFNVNGFQLSFLSFFSSSISWFRVDTLDNILRFCWKFTGVCWAHNQLNEKKIRQMYMYICTYLSQTLYHGSGWSSFETIGIGRAVMSAMPHTPPMRYIACLQIECNKRKRQSYSM